MPSAAAAAAVAVAATRVVTAGAPETVAVNAYAPIVGPITGFPLASSARTSQTAGSAAPATPVCLSPLTMTRLATGCTFTDACPVTPLTPVTTSVVKPDFPVVVTSPVCDTVVIVASL